MSITDFIDSLGIAPATSTHRGSWRPLYLEQMPGSGERVCIGVAGSDGVRVQTLALSGLSRLSAAYGLGLSSFEWAAKLAILEIEGIIGRLGLEDLRVDSVEGLHIGPVRVGVGRSLKDLLSLALQQSSAIEATHQTAAEMATDVESPIRAGPLAGTVRQIVVGVRPALRANFGRTYRSLGARRPTAFGFVGQRLVANFALLGGEFPQALANQVDRAKARLWDLEQLQQGILSDSFGQSMKHVSFELMACPPWKKTMESGTPSIGTRQIRDAADTLEKEADKFDIRWRLFRDAREMANSIITREAA
jgi:hypothetical protein